MLRPGLRVLLADDHPAYRLALAEQLRRLGLDVVADVANGAAAVAAALELRPDVVLMDLNMPGVGGLEATRTLTAEAPPVRVLVLTVSAEHHDLEAATAAGATGYLLKDAALEELVAAVHAVAAGRTVVSHSVIRPALTMDEPRNPHRVRRMAGGLGRPRLAVPRLRRPRQQT